MEGPDDVVGILGDLDLAVGIIDLETFAFIDVSVPTLRRLGMERDEVIGRSVVDLVEPDHRADARLALGAMAAGAVQLYRSHRPMGRPDAPGRLTVQWLRRVEYGDRHVALAEASDGSTGLDSPLTTYLGAEPQTMALGTADADWRIVSVSNEVHQLLGRPPASLIGARLDVPSSTERFHARFRREHPDSCPMSIATYIRLDDGDGTPTTLCCILLAMTASERQCFVLLPADEAGAGAATAGVPMDHRLAQIAAELEATRVLDGVRDAERLTRIQQAASLSVRQYEVFRRLMAGQRVSMIAEALFISESAVRNHLSAIFEQFGVHSQVQLVALFKQHLE